MKMWPIESKTYVCPMKLTHTLFIFIITAFLGTISAQQFVTDVIFINGDRHKALEVDVDKIKNLLDDELTKRKLTIIENQIESADPNMVLYAAELYIYQIIGKRPVINFIIRSEKGIHYQDFGADDFITSNKARLEKGIKELFFGFPLKFDLSKAKEFSSDVRLYFELDTHRLRDYNKVNTDGIQFSSEFESDLAYFIPGDLKSYVVNCINLFKIEQKIQGESLSIYFDINERGKAIYKSVDIPISLSVEQEKRTQGIIEAFPIFKVDRIYTDQRLDIQVSNNIIVGKKSTKLIGYVSGFLIGTILFYLIDRYAL